MHFRRLAGTGGLVALAVLAVLALAAALPLALLSRQLGAGLPAVVFGLPGAAVGVLVAWRQPRNPLGWLFLLTAAGLLLGTDAGNYAVYVYRLGHRLPFGPAGVVLDQVWVPSVVLLVVIILLFPDGTLASGPAGRGVRRPGPAGHPGTAVPGPGIGGGLNADRGRAVQPAAAPGAAGGGPPFNRARYDADLTVAAFAARLQDAVDLDAVAADLGGVVDTVLEAAHVSLWTARRRS